MKEIITLFTLVLLTVSASAQDLKTCATCDSKEIEISNIEDKDLFEIELLRNEIFARHHYVFKNERLTQYFSKFAWYKPSDDFKPLNEIEEKNIETFKKKEEEIKDYRKSVVLNISELKIAITNSDDNYLRSVYSNYDEGSYDIYISTLEQVLTFINPDNIHWHKGKGLYSVKIDNGFAIDEYELSVENGKITMSASNSTYSSLMNHQDAWEYPSQYYSEVYETYKSLDLKLTNGTLKVTSVLLAG